MMSSEGGTNDLLSAAAAPDVKAGNLEPGEDKAAIPADWELQRDEAKAAGDAAFRTQKYDEAIQAYTTALSVDPDNAKILSNRSAAYLQTNQKSKALHDAQKCVELKTMGVKGRSRLAAALQALGRFDAAHKEWNSILQTEMQHAAALKGLANCEKALEDLENKKRKEKEAKEEEKQQQTAKEQEQEAPVDDLDDFFNDVEEATDAVVRQKQEESEEKPTEAIKNHKKDMGTAKDQVSRLLAPNYKWRNLNPFFVLDIDHTSTEEEISRRYKALSLLLHPDKNRDDPRAQEAYDEVLQAKAKLNHENKANHARQLIEQGMKQGKLDYQKQQGLQNVNSNNSHSLEEFQSKAVQRIFAQVEHKRKEVEDRQRKQEQRERQQEEEILSKERDSRKFDKKWKEEERVDKRIGNWRNFQQKKAKSS